MIDNTKLKEFVSSMSDAALVDAVGHLNDITFSKDNIIRQMFEYSMDGDDRFMLYIPTITKALCDEVTMRFKIYSPHI